MRKTNLALVCGFPLSGLNNISLLPPPYVWSGLGREKASLSGSPSLSISVSGVIGCDEILHISVLVTSGGGMEGEM